MDDRFLHEHRRAPDPTFTRSLRQRLVQVEDEAPARGTRWQPWVAAAATLAVVTALSTVPAVRVAAQDLLDLFRVRSFAAVSVDEDRMREIGETIEAGGSSMLAFEREGEAHDPGPPVEYGTVAAAAAAARLDDLRQPTTLPSGMVFEKAAVQSERSTRFVVRAERLRAMLDAIGLQDVRVPMDLEGQRIEVRLPGRVVQRYGNGKRTLTVVEAPSPEVALPAGMDLRELGEIGLRVLGLDAGEARRMAASIDWRSTLLVPIPGNAASFRRVEIGGGQGLFVRLEGRKDASGSRGRGGAMVMWSEGGRVHVVSGDVSEQDVLEVAQGLR